MNESVENSGDETGTSLGEWPLADTWAIKPVTGTSREEKIGVPMFPSRLSCPTEKGP